LFRTYTRGPQAVLTLGQVSRRDVFAAARCRETLELALPQSDPGEERPVVYRDAGDQPGVAVALEGTAGLCASPAAALALRLAGAADGLRARSHQPLTVAGTSAR
jgi:hypothetical protein